jgi:hypothetical protein
MINVQPTTRCRPGCETPDWRAQCTATRRPEWAATKWRNDIAMGVSPWNTNPHRDMSPEGTTGNPAHQTHVAPSGLRTRFEFQIHGFAPVATACRPFRTHVLAPGRYVLPDVFVQDFAAAWDRARR